MSAGKIFINYRREDSKAWSLLLYKALEPAFGPERVFYDIDTIPPGEDFVEYLNAQVARADVLLALIGDKWLHAINTETGQRRLDDPDDFVRIEIAAALADPAVRVIPVMLDQTPIPAEAALPDALAPLIRRNAVRLTHERFDADIGGLTRALQTTLTEAEERRAAEAALAQQKTDDMARRPSTAPHAKSFAEKIKPPSFPRRTVAPHRANDTWNFTSEPVNAPADLGSSRAQSVFPLGIHGDSEGCAAVYAGDRSSAIVKAFCADQFKPGVMSEQEIARFEGVGAGYVSSSYRVKWGAAIESGIPLLFTLFGSFRSDFELESERRSFTKLVKSAFGSKRAQKVDGFNSDPNKEPRVVKFETEYFSYDATLPRDYYLQINLAEPGAVSIYDFATLSRALHGEPSEKIEPDWSGGNISGDLVRFDRQGRSALICKRAAASRHQEHTGYYLEFGPWGDRQREWNRVSYKPKLRELPLPAGALVWNQSLDCVIVMDCWAEDKAKFTFSDPKTLETFHEVSINDINATEVVEHQVSFSRDGAMCAFWSPVQRTISIFDTFSGTKRKTITSAGGPVYSPDGQRLVYFRHGASLGDDRLVVCAKDGDDSIEVAAIDHQDEEYFRDGVPYCWNLDATCIFVALNGKLGRAKLMQ